MESVIAWCGFLGAWLLFAGPIYQAAVELGAEEFEREKLVQAAKSAEQPAHVSQWWWLLPPIGYWKSRQRQQQYQQTVLRSLEPTVREQFISYSSAATGWIFVGFGGLLLAVKETWELTEHFDWPWPVFVALIVLMLALSVGNMTVRVKNAERMLADQPD